MALLTNALNQLAVFYTALYPQLLYATWVMLGIWDLARRDDMDERRRLAWVAAVMVVPLVGPLTYLLLSDSRLSWNIRLLVTAGGALVYVALTAARILIP